MWEYLDDGGLWQACSEEDSFKIEAHFFEGSQQFHLGDYHYHLSHMTRSHPQTRNHQRIKRTVFVQERRDGERCDRDVIEMVREIKKKVVDLFCLCCMYYVPQLM